jgi:hypothetical protein
MPIINATGVPTYHDVVSFLHLISPHNLQPYCYKSKSATFLADKHSNHFSCAFGRQGSGSALGKAKTAVGARTPESLLFYIC